jgi:hypothetical protein
MTFIGFDLNDRSDETVPSDTRPRAAAALRADGYGGSL